MYTYSLCLRERQELTALAIVNERVSNVLRVPPNLHFEIDDAEAEWLYKPSSHDFIHCRYLFHGIRDWPKLINQAMRYSSYIIPANPSSYLTIQL